MENKPVDLEALYSWVKETVSSLDLDSIWPGFRPLKFALYNDKECFYDGQYVEKTDEFCANTAICYQGEQTAIWMIQEDLDTAVLASKIVHEMFHGYQTVMGWDCWPKELEALYRYGYNAENLSLKLRENELLLALLEEKSDAALRELLAHRKLRSRLFPYEFSYEIQVEEIEGTANYVEWQVLKQLDKSRADALAERMRVLVTDPASLFPIRISSYDTGALMISALAGAGRYRFEAAPRPVILSVLKDVEPSDGDFPGKAGILRRTEAAVSAFEQETDAIIRSAVDADRIVLNGPLELTGVNIYDARCRKGYITSTYFLMYRDGEEDRMIPGNFVIRMQDEKTIASVYRWD